MLTESCSRGWLTWCLAVLIHWARLAALGSLLLALVVGQLPRTEVRMQDRLPGQDRRVMVKGGETWNAETGGLWIDPSTGATSTLPLPSGGRFVNAAIAPWQERDGGTQAVGGWISHGTSSLPAGSYLARFALPDGTFLEAVSLTSIVDDPPCWFPGNVDRILFTQQDGGLYEFAFRADRRATQADRPRRLTWRVPRPLGEGSRIHAPSWPVDPRLGGRILVSVEPSATGRRVPELAQLWWLELDETGTAVEAAGPLELPRHPDSPADASPGNGRYPVASADAHGCLKLAYLYKTEIDPFFEVRVAPIEVDKTTGVPIARTERARVLARGCQPTPPIFCTDGCSLIAVSAEPTRLEVSRCSLARSRFSPSRRSVTPGSL